MAGETSITVVGNLTADPELRYTQAGVAFASFTIASTPRTFDRNSNEWKDGETLFLRATVWREFAEHVSQSLTKGTRVVATGTLRSHQYETAQGEKRTSIDLDVDEVGPSLRYATAAITRTSSGGAGGAGFSGGAPRGGGASSAAPVTDAWATPGAATDPSADAWANPGASADDTPF